MGSQLILPMAIEGNLVYACDKANDKLIIANLSDVKAVSSIKYNIRFGNRTIKAKVDICLSSLGFKLGELAYTRYIGASHTYYYHFNCQNRVPGMLYALKSVRQKYVKAFDHFGNIHNLSWDQALDIAKQGKLCDFPFTASEVDELIQGNSDIGKLFIEIRRAEALKELDERNSDLENQEFSDERVLDKIMGVMETNRKELADSLFTSIQPSVKTETVADKLLDEVSSPKQSENSEVCEFTSPIRTRLQLYVEILRESHIGDVFSIPNSIMLNIKCSIRDIIDSSIKGDKLTSISVITLDDDKQIGVIRSDNTQNDFSTIQIMWKSESNTVFDPEKIRQTYLDWRSSRRFIGYV